MKSFSSFCIALSAAALLAGALPGQAQSQTGTRFFDVASGRTIERVETRPATPGLLGLPATLGFFAISTRLDLFRLLESRDIQRWLTVSVTEDNQRFALFTDLGVKGNGVYRGRRESGERVAGTVSGFGSAAFSDPDAELIVSGTVTVPNPDAAGNLDLAYQTIREAGGWREVLRQMLYMESVYESARYGGGTERLGGRNSIIDRNSVIEPNSAEIITSSSAEHIARGTDITGRAADLLSANMRVYINGEDITAGKGEGTSRLSCAGLECSVKSNVPSDPSEGNTQNLVRRSFPVLSASHFVPTDTGNAGEEGFVAAADKVDVVQSHQGIHLALDRSGSNVLESPLAFGAWMDDAGFFVATRRTPLDYSQTVVAIGERTGSAPDADARWLGSMVGAVMVGGNQNHLLRGGARLQFKMRTSRLNAEFFNIRDYDRFGAKHIMQEVETGPRNRLHFKRIRVHANGSYGRTYGEDEGGGGIRGAFYGTDHAETAGTFERFGIAAAFGAKKLTN